MAGLVLTHPKSDARATKIQLLRNIGFIAVKVIIHAPLVISSIEHLSHNINARIIKRARHGEIR
jgi:hypothetical protein